MKYSLHLCVKLQKAMQEILESNQLTGNGICMTLHEKGCYTPFVVILKLAGRDRLYYQGFGPDNKMNTLRKNFLALFTTITARELQEMIEGA